MSPSAITRSGGCSLKGCRVFSPARTIRRCQCRVTPNIVAARALISSDNCCSPMPARIIARRSISSNSCAALSWASRSRSARAFSSKIGFVTATMLRPNGALMSLVVPPYPPPRYTKDEPQVSAWLKRSDEPPDYETYGIKYHYLANQQATGGDYGLYRVDIAPAGGGPGPHFHRAMSEAFFVLSGTMKLYDGNEWIDGHPHDFLYVPPGGIHGFRNEADEPASVLMLFAPGAPREAYFEGFSALADMTDDERQESV